MTQFELVASCFVVGLNGVYAALIIYWLRRWPSDWTRRLVRLTLAWAGGLALLTLACFGLDTGAEMILRQIAFFPVALQMIWIAFLLPALTLPLLTITLLDLLWRAWRSFRKPTVAPTPESKGLTRRRFLSLAIAGAAPMGATLLATHGLLSDEDLRVRDFTIPIAGLPASFEGFTIVHVSDLHSGLFVGPRRLRQIGAAVNALRADLIVVTGDLINRLPGELEAVLPVLHALRAPHGYYLCEGNHDAIPGTEWFRRACAAHGLPLLYNQSTTVTRAGGRLLLAGLPWMNEGFLGHSEIVERLYPARQPGDVRLLLAHHPHLFDIASSVDLVLSGHTHGGQLMLGPFGVGSVFFRYWSGLYRRGASSLVVSNGCGDWFPCRIGAPAEIGLLRLTAAV